MADSQNLRHDVIRSRVAEVIRCNLVSVSIQPALSGGRVQVALPLDRMEELLSLAEAGRRLKDAVEGDDNEGKAVI